MSKVDPEILAHHEWIGFVQPTGLVVSPPALVRAGVILSRSDAEGQRLLRECVEERKLPAKDESSILIPDFQVFARKVLNWSFTPKYYAGIVDSPIPDDLEVPLPEYNETLRPDYAVREPEPQNGQSPWQLLIRVVNPDQDLDRVLHESGRLEGSLNSRMERLLRQTGVPAGLLFNGQILRVISAPRGESSGWMDFRVGDMLQTAGRPISTALRLLLSQTRLLGLPRDKRLAALLEDSRKYQNEVSERLAEQVLHALYELLRGFQAAHDASNGELLRQPLAEHPDEVYRGLLTVLLRMVFLLYAEERDMLPEDETFTRYYKLAGIYDRLREDAALYPDTMDQRFGAWAQLLVLFRMIFDGAECGPMHLPKRHGVLFDPDRFPFLEGRPPVGGRQIHERIEPPRVPDGTIYRALEKLLVLDGERISYRALDVEQIGSVYQGMMGFSLETATGRSVAIKAPKKWAAPTTVDLDALLEETKDKRGKWLQDRTERKFSDAVNKSVKDSDNLEDLHAALQPVIDNDATPDLVPNRAMILQPSEERRRSGSHYTPRALTEPIVRTTLEPILARLRGIDNKPPKSEQILDLKVCDPAIGSGAFLVEACRQLGDALIESWNAHGVKPDIPPDEDEVTFARRLIAQRCLYGVDRNPVAVDLAKMSLWLVTLAKDHALTFVDHALRDGDSLVGLSCRQIEALHWDPSEQVLRGLGVHEAIEKVTELRWQIRDANDSVTAWELQDLWDETQFESRKVKLFGDLIIASFFENEKAKDRESRRNEYAQEIINGNAEQYRESLEEKRHDDPPLAPFHWELEFPEVFDRENPGFDAIVGNPPFLGGTRISTQHSPAYFAWITSAFIESGDRADLVAYFFRRAFGYLRQGGCFGFVATNTISQGDTRFAGLRWICQEGGTIFNAKKRLRWPGEAAVVVSVVHIQRDGNSNHGTVLLDGRPHAAISSFLLPGSQQASPVSLTSNKGICFEGMAPYGSGFLFDNRDPNASTLALKEELVQQDQRVFEVVRPYLVGEDLNTDPQHYPSRWIIDFGLRTEQEARQWPRVFEIVENKVKPKRLAGSKRIATPPWWLFLWPRPELRRALKPLERALVCSKVSSHVAFAFVPTTHVLSNRLAVFTCQEHSFFCLLQSRIHEVWARCFGSTLKDDPVYAPSDCFETFPFPENWETHPALEATGKAYYEFRAALMVRNNEGLTKTYNRFHNPDETDPEIVKLRELHAAMDRAVLEAYGWSDIPTDCEFLLDYEIDEEGWGSRKKPYRYRWPDEVRDKVLARLLELNAERAREEIRSGATANESRPRKSKTKRKNTQMETLF
jgi:hypothetical protein